MTDDGQAPLSLIAPPFNFNASTVAQSPPELSGNYLLQCLRRRLGWSSFADKTLLDFGCGVRFSQTIHNLNLDFGLYVGVDVNREAIEWLTENVNDTRFKYVHLDAKNTFYNRSGKSDLSDDILQRIGVPECDAVCMFSVITHQSPVEARQTFAQVRRVTRSGGQLYFTTFCSDDVDKYVEIEPRAPGQKSAYHPAFLMEMVEAAGWKVKAIHAKSQLQQIPFVCVAV